MLLQPQRTRYGRRGLRYGLRALCNLLNFLYALKLTPQTSRRSEPLHSAGAQGAAGGAGLVALRIRPGACCGSFQARVPQPGAVAD